MTAIRTPAARAAEVERLTAYSPTGRRFWEESARLEDATKLRKRLIEKHAPGPFYSFAPYPNVDVAAKVAEWKHRDLTNRRVDRVVRWAKDRMRRADERFAARVAAPLEWAA